MSPRTTLRLLLPTALMTASVLGAQETPDPAEPARDSVVSLAFEREVFTYPQFTRRNPFRPLITAVAGGPRYEQLHLLGIIQAEDPTDSVVLFGVGEMPQVNDEGQATDPEAATGMKIRTYRLRRGDVIGNTRVLEIQRMQVTVEVEEFGLTERRIMALPRPNRGGTS